VYTETLKYPWVYMMKSDLLKKWLHQTKKYWEFVLGAHDQANDSGSIAIQGWLKRDSGWFPVKFNTSNLPYSFLPEEITTFPLAWWYLRFTSRGRPIGVLPANIYAGILVGENCTLALQFHPEMDYWKFVNWLFRGNRISINAEKWKCTNGKTTNYRWI